jgi:hypothetical protein
MQTNVIGGFENGALFKYREKVALKEQDREYTFGEVERFARNWTIASCLKRMPGISGPVEVGS